MEEITFGALKLSVKNENDDQYIIFKGKSDDRDPSVFLKPFFDQTINDIKGSLFLDFSQLLFMNSSTIPPLIYFIRNLDLKGIKTTFYYNSDSKWQCTSFKAFNTISTHLKNISIMCK